MQTYVFDLACVTRFALALNTAVLRVKLSLIEMEYTMLPNSVSEMNIENLLLVL